MRLLLLPIHHHYSYPLPRGFRADYGFVATMDREIMHDPEREVGYGITDSWDEIVETLQGAPVSTDTELGGYVREFETRVRQDKNEIYMRLDDEQTERQLLAGRSTYASDLVHGEVMSLRTTVLGQMSEIKELQAADRRRQTVISKLLRIDHRRSTEISELRTALQRQAMIDQGVTVALAARDALRSTNGDDSHNSETGTEGVASLSQWCERIESVFHISNCATENQVKFATCTLHSVALTWWNTHIQTVGHEAGYGMSWKTLMKMMTDKYCPRNEIRKLEMKL
nr:reverse transcriptase domain-containing protein [Tanacetum cinerariifolium]